MQAKNVPLAQHEAVVHEVMAVADGEDRADRIENDIRKLAGFGTRNTFSDTVSETRGIGAARRWIKSEFETISKNCNNCLNVFYQKDFVPNLESCDYYNVKRLECILYL